MKTSTNGINLICKFEGIRLKAYKCPAGVWTIGYGTTRINGKPVTKGLKITKAEAEKLLRVDLDKFEKAVMKYNDKYNWTQNEFDAMVSFCYNVGSITGLTVFGTRSKAVIAEKILLYNKANGKVLFGLKRRREAERELFISRPVSKPVVKPVIKQVVKPMVKPVYYIVKSGDTLSKIADAFKTSVDAIVKLNKIKNQDIIRIGQKIRIK